MNPPELSFVLPLFRTAEHVEELVGRIDAVASRLRVDHEIVLVDDACPAGSGARAALAIRDRPHARVVTLPENLGQDGALRAGLRVARGVWAVLLDADLQDPPEAVASLWAARAGYSVVFARRTGSYTTRGRRLTSRLYRRVAAFLSGLPHGACLFALLERNVIDRVIEARSPGASILASIASCRPAATAVTVVRARRPSGVSAYGARRRLVKSIASLWQMFIVRTRMSENPSRRSAALATQVEYFASRRPIRILPVDTPYVRRHFDELASACRLAEREAVCEWGAGLGRFSRLALARGAELTAIELSSTLANECRENLAHEARARVEAGDVLEVLARSDKPFDLMLGFFVLHHLPELRAYFTAAARRLKPGGRAAFAEPNPYNPLYPVQIALTPGMRFRGEAGMYRLTPGTIERAAREAGFSRLTIRRYGALPRAPYNLLAKIRSERLLEALTPEPLRPFQAIVAWK